MGEKRERSAGKAVAESTSFVSSLAQRANSSWKRVSGVPAVGRSIRAAVLLATGLKNEPITLRASALTYLTLLSLIPLLAVVFSIFQAVVGTAELQQHLHEFILRNLAVGARENFAGYVEHYVQRATGAALGGVGFVFLLSSAVSLLANIESAFNHTFQVSKPRSLASRIGIYWSLLTLGPLVLSLSIAGTALLQSSSALSILGEAREILLWGLPFVATYMGFTILYWVVPATKVKWSAALIGAVVAGTLWEAAKIGYTWISAMSVRRDAIYGSLSAIPVFLLWAYLSWILVLFGARVAWAAQNSSAALSSDVIERPVGRELIAAQVLRLIAQAFHDGSSPPVAATMADELQTADTPVLEALEQLQRAGLIREITDGGWQPALPLSRIRLAHVYKAVHGSWDSTETLHPEMADLVQRWRACDEAVEHALATTYEELVERSEPVQEIRAIKG